MIGPAAATVAATAAAGPIMVRTYTEKYSGDNDVLNGAYDALYELYRTAATLESLFKHAVDSSQVIPKVYLYLTEVEDKPVIAAMHRPSRYEAHPIEPSQWDGMAFVFKGDVMTGNHLPMYQLPGEAFDRTEPTRVPTVAAMDGLIGSIPPGEYYIPAPAAGAALEPMDAGSRCSVGGVSQPLTRPGHWGGLRGFLGNTNNCLFQCIL